MNSTRQLIFINLLLISSLNIACYGAQENFLAQNNTSVKKRSTSKVKQDMVEVLASVLELECKSIEVNAKIQQEICKRITEIAEGDKNSKISTAKADALQLGLEKLNEIKKNLEDNLKKSQDTLNFIQNGCVVIKK